MSDEGWASIPIWLLRDRSIDRDTKFVYLLLSARIREEGVCWPSQKLLGEEAGVSERTARRIIADLKARGLIEVTVKATSHGRTNVYRLLVHPFFGPGGQDTGVPTHQDTSGRPSRTTRTTTTRAAR